MRSILKLLFLDFQKAAVPLSRNYSESERLRSTEIVFDVVDTKSLAVRLKLLVFFILVEMLSILAYTRPVGRLRPHQQKTILNIFFNSRIPLLRKGFWGANTLAKMSVYGDPQIYPSIGYKLRPLPNERTES